VGAKQRIEATYRPRGWHSRGYLPHFDGGKWLPQVVTFRLADSVPGMVVLAWREELRLSPPPECELELRKRLDKYLDAGYGACHLRDPRVGATVQAALLYFDTRRYRLHAWVIMPNHVHVLFTPAEGWALADILGSWKSFTAKKANDILGRSGQFWKEEYFDRFIRDETHFDRALASIENNPVKAGLCATPSDWPFGSARLKREAEAAETAAVPGGQGRL
jgi:REP element-mobilizing transposase RayT